MLKTIRKEICANIFTALKKRGFTYEQCCHSFNHLYKEDIEMRGLKKLNKDFLYRIKKENFSPTNIRVVKLCEFLHIDTNKLQTTQDLCKEALMVDELVKMKPHLQNEIAVLIHNLIVLTDKTGASK
ncbi:hypothetical protein [Phocoenobacter skyensis]|uniref:Uncharacterized protein n=1 Tax=Phocoenobacter skyensis TaxID=97481 RepID=A0A1H7XNG9_9PAST|nr:hypothetical protein [Pasteurella skyensis]MDP8080080.1 hypothetical protein [Pasteurella skyensis]MDP8086072.1 hypothetical protein [Pasteurella skyensis]MDP8185763.1 hypothetical protein [Pasteurella skyensis]QLB22650.1 hypothetical protein A6B44_05285 [Pasteurella skyensis]SEM35193.1 hypothetical protein SAMN05444853_11352 [Pasteurella skyensis]